MAEGEQYWNLRPTISISFVNDLLFPEASDYHLDFALRSSAHPGLIFSDRQQIHVIELPKFRKTADELADPLDAWCYFLKNAATLDSDQLPAGMQIPPVQSAMEVLNVVSQTEMERAKYLSKQRAWRDSETFYRDVREKWGVEAELMMRERADARFRELQALEEANMEKKKIFINRIHFCQRLLGRLLTPAEELEVKSSESLEADVVSLENELLRNAGKPNS